jgi:hypothetical protein
MLNMRELKFGFSDAENYRRKENREFFNNIFLRTEALDKLCEINNYFLVGEKGTGKTAYAVFLANNFYKNNHATIRYVRETEYQKFVTLKNERQLALSDYANIWKVLAYLLLAEQINDLEKEGGILPRRPNFKNLKGAIDEFYANAFSPEIICALRFVEESNISASIISNHVKIGEDEKTGISFTCKNFQTNLLYIQKEFEDALSSIKIQKHFY